ncbi:MAG TPA: hypothetical protein VE775_06610 [Pyrinomonadaceae bacterium]|nr:hypothetical protein [Pyrinomonadaceae bacterium]
MLTNGRLSVCALWRALPACLALLLGACAAARGPDAGPPRANEPAYPVILAASTERREQATAAWQALVQEQGVAAKTAALPELQNVTATINALPPGVELRLPKIELANNNVISPDEATREALRRFLTPAAPLLGVAAKDLSLVEIKDEGAGTKLARYQQKPFPYPLRGGFGVLEIRFTTDGRVVALTSTALPDAERLARLLAVQPQKLTAKDAETRLAGRAFNYQGADNSTLAYTVGPNEQVKARELVVYPSRRAGDAAALELHLAWELAVTRGAGEPLLVYVDALTGDIIGATASPPPQAQSK